MSDRQYLRMGIAAKQAHQRSLAREPSVVCPICEVQTTARDLIDHLDKRCAGQREPHPGSAWVTFAAALKLGILRGTLSRWVAKGQVRVRGDLQDRQYLLRDLAMLVAQRRKFPKGNRARP